MHQKLWSLFTGHHVYAFADWDLFAFSVRTKKISHLFSLIILEQLYIPYGGSDEIAADTSVSPTYINIDNWILIDRETSFERKEKHVY